jgi:septation ring formation regulator EzrA
MRRRDSFDFGHTCPRIDKEIRKCKERIEDDLTRIIQSICEDISYEEAWDLAKKHTKEVYPSFEGCFEAVRRTNEEMRDAANGQLADLEDEIEALKDEIEAIKDKLDSFDCS